MTFENCIPKIHLAPHEMIRQLSLHLSSPSQELLKIAKVVPECLKCRELSFAGNKYLTETALVTWIEKCHLITVLDLSDIGDLSLKKLPTRKKLKALDLSSSIVNVEDLIDYLKRQRTLTTLMLNGMNITREVILKILSAAPNLTFFSNLNNRAIIPKDIHDIQTALTAAKHSCALSF